MLSLTCEPFDSVDVAVQFLKLSGQIGVSGHVHKIGVSVQTELDSVIVEALETQLATVLQHLLGYFNGGWSVVTPIDLKTPENGHETSLD